MVTRKMTKNTPDGSDLGVMDDGGGGSLKMLLGRGDVAVVMQ